MILSTIKLKNIIIMVYVFGCKEKNRFIDPFIYLSY